MLRFTNNTTILDQVSIGLSVMSYFFTIDGIVVRDNLIVYKHVHWPSGTQVLCVILCIPQIFTIIENRYLLYNEMGTASATPATTKTAQI